MAAAIFAATPPTFAPAGISMGGYICFEIMRQAPPRVLKLALLDTSARLDTPQQSADRRALVTHARDGDFEALLTRALSAIVHPARRNDPDLRIRARHARA